MAKRRRYDTEALVGQLKAERRAGILLSVAGLAILLVLAILYFTGVGDEEEIPEVPGSGAPGSADAKPPAAGGEAPAPAVSGTTPEPAAPASSDGGGVKAGGVASVSVDMPKPGTIWIGKRKLAKGKTRAEVPPGKVLVKAKIGKKTFKTTVEVSGGESLELLVDLKKKKLTVKDQ